MNRLLLCLLTLITVLVSCQSTGKRALALGDYDLAVIQATEKLKHAPDNQDARNSLKLGYEKAASTHLQNIQFALASRNTLRAETILDAYASLNRLADAIRRTPAALEVVPNPTFYTQEAQQARENAAIARYELGKIALDASNTAAARDAVTHFRAALAHQPDIRDANILLARATQAATIHVVIQPITCAIDGIDTAFLQNHLRSSLNQRSEFVHYHSPQTAASRGIQPHQLAYLEFTKFVVGEETRTQQQRRYQDDHIVIGHTRGNPPQKVYGCARATLITYTKKMTAEVELQLRIVNAADSAVLEHLKLPAAFTWTDEWGTYRGDERALPVHQHRIAHTNETPTPGHQQLFEAAVENLFAQACRQLTEFHKQHQ